MPRNWTAFGATSVVAIALLTPPTAHAVPFYANYQLIIPERYDFHTWTWAVSYCVPEADDCVQINAIPMPVAKAFEYRGNAYRTDGRYTLIVDVPDGLRCGNVYYGSVIPTRDVYSWDTTTLEGTLESSFESGCDDAPGGTYTYQFSLVRL